MERLCGIISFYLQYISRFPFRLVFLDISLYFILWIAPNVSAVPLPSCFGQNHAGITVKDRGSRDVDLNESVKGKDFKIHLFDDFVKYDNFWKLKYQSAFGDFPFVFMVNDSI